MTTLLDDLKAVNAYEEPAAPRVLTVDIETSPNLVYTWGIWQQNVSISQIVEPSRVLCFAAKWLGDKQVQFFSEYHDGREAMIQAAWELYNEADVVVTYNGVRFDNAHLQREWLLAGFSPPKPWIDCDLLVEVKRHFKFQSNKLAFVTDQTGLPTKLDTGGQSLWNAVMNNDGKAWEKFKNYNRQDVKITEQLFLFLQKWIKGPHSGQWTGRMFSCYACGSDDLTFSGVQRYRTLSYPTVTCSRCGTVNKLLRSGQTRAA